MLALANGEIEPRDNRVFACPSRMIPAEDLGRFEAEAE